MVKWRNGNGFEELGDLGVVGMGNAFYKGKKQKGEMKMKVKFYNGRKLVRVVMTDSPSRVINEMIQSTQWEWTRYKIC